MNVKESKKIGNGKAIAQISFGLGMALFFVILAFVFASFSGGTYSVLGTDGEASATASATDIVSGETDEATATADQGGEGTDDSAGDATDSGESTESATPEDTSGNETASPAETDSVDETEAPDTSEAPDDTASAEATLSATANPTQSATTNATATTTTNATAKPTDTKKPTSTAGTVKPTNTPKPTLAGLDAPVVTNGQVVDVEDGKENNPTDTSGSNNRPADTVASADSGAVLQNRSGGWSTFFNILKYIFIVCAILSGSYALYIAVTYLLKIFRDKSKNVKKTKQNGNESGTKK